MEGGRYAFLYVLYIDEKVWSLIVNRELYNCSWSVYMGIGKIGEEYMRTS